MKYLVPEISIRDLPFIVALAVAGAFLAGIYGVVHDQITFAISPEYFTNLKFEQFHYARVENERLFVAIIGFLATWWAGCIIAWFLARRLVPGQNRKTAVLKMLKGFAVVFISALIAGLAGYTYGIWRGPDADYSKWEPFISPFAIKDTYAFVRVAYIHDASYLGGLLGLIAAMVFIRRDD